MSRFFTPCQPVPTKNWMDKLEDVELAAIVRARLDQPEIEMSLDEL